MRGQNILGTHSLAYLMPHSAPHQPSQGVSQCQAKVSTAPCQSHSCTAVQLQQANVQTKEDSWQKQECDDLGIMHSLLVTFWRILPTPLAASIHVLKTSRNNQYFVWNHTVNDLQ